MGDSLLEDIHPLRTGGPQAGGSNLEGRMTFTRGSRLSLLGNNPALSMICAQHLNRRPNQTPQVPYHRARYGASSGNESLSPQRMFLFMMLRNVMYKLKSMQANLGLPRPA